MKSVGFIGLGHLGRPMAEAILDSQYQLIVYDINSCVMQQFEERGAISASSPAAVAELAQIILVCVRTDDDVRNVVSGDQGILRTAASGTIVMIHSTIGIDTLLEVANQGSKLNVHVLDVAVTGGVNGAHNRALCYMFGGSEEMLQLCLPILELSSERVVPAGNLGAGMALKICNNMMTWSSFIAVHEGLKLARAAGLTLDHLREVSKTNGVLTNQMIEFVTDREQFLQSSTKESFLTEGKYFDYAALGEKDLDSAIALGNNHEQSLPGCRADRSLIRDVLLDLY